jgi:hypothetical protein
LARLAPAVTPKLLGIGRREVSSSRRIAEFKIAKNQGDSDFALRYQWLQSLLEAHAKQI